MRVITNWGTPAISYIEDERRGITSIVLVKVLGIGQEIVRELLGFVLLDGSVALQHLGRKEAMENPAESPVC